MKICIKCRKDKLKPVLQFDKDRNLVAEYNSIKEAVEKTNSIQSKITLVCQGKRKTHNGFIWRYKYGKR